MKRWHLPTLEASSDKRTAREPGADAPRIPSAGAPKPRVLFSAPECRLIALDLDAGRRAIRPRGPRACSRAGDLRPRRDRRLGRHRRMRGRNARDVRPRRTPCSPRPRRSTAPAHTRALAGSRTQHGDGGTTRSTSARKRHRRAARLLTFRRDDEGRLRTSTSRRDRFEQMARRAEESSRSNCGVLGVLDDEVCYWQREAIERRLGASFLEPAGILVRQCGDDHFVGRKVRSASSIALTGRSHRPGARCRRPAPPRRPRRPAPLRQHERRRRRSSTSRAGRCRRLGRRPGSRRPRRHAHEQTRAEHPQAQMRWRQRAIDEARPQPLSVGGETPARLRSLCAPPSPTSIAERHGCGGRCQLLAAVVGLSAREARPADNEAVALPTKVNG